MTPADLSATVLHAVRSAVDAHVLRAPVPSRVRVERTRPGGTGDYATAVALQLAGPAARPAREVAEILCARMSGLPGLGRVEVTGAGFLNFTLDAGADTAAHRAVLAGVRERGARYGYGDALAGEVLRLRPAGEVRAAVTADAVRRLARAQGARVRVDHAAGTSGPDLVRLGVEDGTDMDAVPDTAPSALAAARDTAPSAVAAARGAAPSAGAAARGAAPSALAAARDTPAAGTVPDAAPAIAIRPVPAGATAAELLRRLGPDAARWGLLRPAGHDRADLGDHLLVQGEGNALFLVRHAHARTHAMTRGAALLGFAAAGPDEAAAVPAGPEEVALYGLLADHPAELAAAARHRAPDRLARHLEAVAHAFLDVHDAASPLPVGDEKPSAAHRSRLALAEAAGTVLAGGLSLLGISAPPYL
ncbi:ArgS-related anticodon-binding protein NrtL [Streptomyces sp. NPDC059783]|uniref:ArgS-related anticodon-binding protein NrtL n=1 Tax=Streptomyces sp. NPDC059783 TaxID=3346944 RepID=UPI0036677AE5